MKIFAFLSAIKHWLGNGGTGNTVGNIVANGSALIALLAAAGTAGVWLHEHRNEILTTITYGQAFLFLVVLAIILKIVHWSRPGKIDDRSQ